MNVCICHVPLIQGGWSVVGGWAGAQRRERGRNPSWPEHRDAGHWQGAALRMAAAHISHVQQNCHITGLSLVKASGCFLWCFLNYCFGFQKFYIGTRHHGKLTGNRSRVVRLEDNLAPEAVTENWHWPG